MKGGGCRLDWSWTSAGPWRKCWRQTGWEGGPGRGRGWENEGLMMNLPWRRVGTSRPRQVHSSCMQFDVSSRLSLCVDAVRRWQRYPCVRHVRSRSASRAWQRPLPVPPLQCATCTACIACMRWWACWGWATRRQQERWQQRRRQLGGDARGGTAAGGQIDEGLLTS